MKPAELLDGETGEIVAMNSGFTGLSEDNRNSVSLMLPPNLSFDDWVSIGSQLCAMERGVQWWIGDWWAFGGNVYGDRAKASAQGMFGRAFQTCANAASVARSFETSRRREVLSFTHHAEVAGLPPETADRLLDGAEREGWSKAELRQQVGRVRNAERIGADNPSEETGRLSDLYAGIERGLKFGAIYADPPWIYDNQGTRAATGNHYSGLTVDELCALPIRDLAADDAHLHLWTTNAFLFDCEKIFDAWGFEFRSSFVWVKPQMGIGNYWRNSHEFMLTAIRGNAKRFNDRSLMSWLQCDRGAHSSKPDQVRSYIERASPGPYLELFARREYPRWSAWGNQITSTLFDSVRQEVA